MLEQTKALVQIKVGVLPDGGDDIREFLVSKLSKMDIDKHERKYNVMANSMKMFASQERKLNLENMLSQQYIDYAQYKAELAELDEKVESIITESQLTVKVDSPDDTESQEFSKDSIAIAEKFSMSVEAKDGDGWCGKTPWEWLHLSGTLFNVLTRVVEEYQLLGEDVAVNIVENLSRELSKKEMGDTMKISEIIEFIHTIQTDWARGGGFRKNSDSAFAVNIKPYAPSVR